MNFYLWIGPILAALVIVYVTYHVYKGYRNKPKD